MPWPPYVARERGDLIEIVIPVYSACPVGDKRRYEALAYSAVRYAREVGGEVIGRWDLDRDDLRCRISWIRRVFAADDRRVSVEMAEALTRMQACARWLAGEAVETIEAGFRE